MQPLLPGYEHDIERGAGLSVGVGRPKVVLHTTESPHGSYNAVRNMWRGPNNWGRGLPHFLADGARYVQLLPLNVGAYTLENSPGGADTNRSGPAIQVEICTYAKDGLNDLEIEALARWLAALVNAGVDLDLSQHPTFYGLDAGFTLATYNARQRMTADAYNAFNGFCGHQHVPENAHWDPGKLDGLKVERLARGYLGGKPDPTPIPPIEDEEDDHMKSPRPCFSAPKGTYGCRPDGKLAYIGGPDTLAKLTTPNQGNPAELQPAVSVSDETLATLIHFYGMAD